MKKGSKTNLPAINRIELIGKKFNRLIVIGESQRRGTQKQIYYYCKCDCGNEIEVLGQSIRTGNTASCGCYHKERTSEASFKHGLSHTSIHNIWMSMRKRCNDESNHAYKDYGGRGIKVCHEWGIFENFLSDMGMPEKGMTIERVNNNLGYNKENCIWSNREVQANNRRSNKFITFDGETLTQRQWEKKYNLREGIIYDRLRRGWSVERAILTSRK